MARLRTLCEAQVEHGAFCTQSDRKGRLRYSYRLCGQPVEILICVSRVMMEQHQVFCGSEGSKGHSLLHSTMPPPHTIGVFFVTVLSIMDQEVHIGGKGVAGRPLASQ